MKIRMRTAVVLLLVSLGMLSTVVTTHAQNSSPFEACPQDTSLISNATIYIPGNAEAPIGDSLQAGDKIALFTSDDTCTGIGTWNEAPLAITMYGSDPWSSFNGYEEQEALRLKVWDASRQSVHTTKGIYKSCEGDSLSTCKDDGHYMADALYTLLDFSSALPVELISFDATPDEGDVVFTWHTASESNNKGFRIEQRSVGTEKWARIAFVESQAENGTSAESLTYHFRATDLDPGQHVFRLVQRDLGGHETPVGKKQHVEIGLAEAYDLSLAFPNPFGEHTTVRLAVRETQKVTVAAYDMLGRQVALLHEGMLEPNTPRQFTFEGTSHSSGLYFIRVNGQSFQAVRKALLVR